MLGDLCIGDRRQRMPIEALVTQNLSNSNRGRQYDSRRRAFKYTI